MIKIGQTNKLIIDRFTDFGAYLKSASDNEINTRKENEIKEVLLPIKYLTPEMVVGDEIEAFVYNDSEDRPVAVTTRPFAEAGQFAFLQVTDVNRVGAFLDWGLPKDLLVPFKEQNIRMLQGGVYPVYVYVDNATNRVLASAKLEKFLGNVYPDYHIGEVVDCLVLTRNDVGYKVVVNNAHLGMIYFNEIHTPLTIQQEIKARVKKVRPDGKLDLSLGDRTDIRMEELANTILNKLRELPSATIELGDKSSPEEIDRTFKCSKKDFKRALGHLYKKRVVAISDRSVSLLDNK